MSRLRKRFPLMFVALLSTASFVGFTNAELSFLFKAYGLLLTCQIGFLLFFLSQIPARKTLLGKSQKKFAKGVDTPR
jgi:hypothetical protein